MNDRDMNIDPHVCGDRGVREVREGTEHERRKGGFRAEKIQTPQHNCLESDPHPT